MKIEHSNIKGVALINLESNIDDRGQFTRLWCQEELKTLMNNDTIKQINTSLSKKRGTLRGLHFQYPPLSEIKFVKCIKGKILDVIVDIRYNSKTYGSYVKYELNSYENKIVCIPKGCAHGFLTLIDNTEIIYFVTSNYSKESEGIMRWNDKFHNIEWPFKPTIISKKDLEVDDWNDDKAIMTKE